MSIKTGLSLSTFLLYDYSSFWYYRPLLHYGKFKKSEENKNKLRIYPKNREILLTASLGSNSTGSYKK